MNRAVWRSIMPWYLAFVIAFPLAMGWVEWRPLTGRPICAFRIVTHFDCPGCGMTRAFRSMGRLDVGEAIRYNLLGPVAFLVAVIWWVYALAMLLTNGRIILPNWWMRWRYRLLWAGIIIYLLTGFIRIAYEFRHPPLPPTAINFRGGQIDISPSDEDFHT